MFQFSTKSLTFTVVAAIFIAVLIRILAIEAFRIPTKAMTPTLQPGDLAIVNKMSYGMLNMFSEGYFFRWKDIDRGDIIVFPLPDDPERLFIKRVVGLAGEKIRIESNGSIHINGEKISFPGWSHQGSEILESVIPDGKVFVVGDQPGLGTDSRHWGSVNESSVIGKVWLVFSGNKLPKPPKMPLSAELALK